MIAGYHRLTGKVHARGTLRHLQVARAGDLRERAVVDDELRILDRRALVADDQPRALEHVAPDGGGSCGGSDCQPTGES